jgi:hypothetical protein
MEYKSQKSQKIKSEMTNFLVLLLTLLKRQDFVQFFYFKHCSLWSGFGSKPGTEPEPTLFQSYGPTTLKFESVSAIKGMAGGLWESAVLGIFL